MTAANRSTLVAANEIRGRYGFAASTALPAPVIELRRKSFFEIGMGVW
jgi:hypothetical protein